MITDGPSATTSLLEEIRALLKDESTEHGRRALNAVIVIVTNYDEKWQAQETRRKEQSASVIKQMTAEGKKTGGGVPYGYELAVNGVNLCEKPDEQRVIEEARRLYAQGFSLRAVAAQLKQASMFPREEQEDDLFHAAQIWRMLDEKSRRQHQRVKREKKTKKH